MITIIGGADRDKCNGSRRVTYQCSCGYIGTTREIRAKKIKWCRGCSQKYSRLKINEYKIVGDIAYIDVSTEKFPDAICEIDVEDLDKVIDGNGRWLAVNFNKNVVYASRNSRGTKMHRHILSLPKGLVVDHDDGNGLNNKKTNLNIGNQAMNVKNRPLSRNNVSGFHGVVPSPTPNKWVAKGASNGKRYHLGTFTSLSDAIAARKKFEAEHGFNKNHGRSSL